MSKPAAEKIQTEISNKGGTKGKAMIKNKSFPTNEEILNVLLPSP
jgi:hypothetical protein